MVLKSLVDIRHSIQDQTIEFVYLATTENNPDVKPHRLPNTEASRNSEVFSWFPYSYISEDHPDEFSEETKEIIDKIEQGSYFSHCKVIITFTLIKAFLFCITF